MNILWRDQWGIVYTTVDENGVQFNNGFAYFGDGSRDYKVPVDWIVEIK